ncbi:lysophospholipid acyltransferase family protein [Streptomyces aureoverticillatus]|uniref:lysophospholipid acyltransferase family protein n=1 Tax=Streptomyces aureoverticillatus TaxID=66871 RepID=UPI0013DB0E7B|nr:lysophospholipid acyltransferase family protein [Streptomyces aureoverticillatus]QIB44321.1 acyltransferase family protein [Streptomyces aureoverticillatus]
MADAKVIPFDDDRSRGGGQRPQRRRSGPRRPGDGAKVREVKVVPGRRNADVPDGAAPGAEPLDAGALGAADADAGSVGSRSAGADAAPEPAAVPEPRGGGGGGWDRRIAGGLAFLRRRLTGEYDVDDFGYDEELTDQVLMSLLRPFYEKYFRVEVKGIENIPADGGALIVANHSGTLPLDGLMMQVAVHDNHPHQRHLRLLAADLVFMLPVINELARKAGHTLACAEDAEALLERGELVGVMPEGFKGIGKPFGERYKLQRFGRGGFVSTALRTGSPIVPCSIVGAEEIYPMIGNAKTLARVLGIPYFPLTPTFPWLGPLGMVPLPTKWTIQFGEAIPTDGYPPEAAEDPMLMFNLTDQVREQIQHTLYKLLVQRRSVFF